MSELVSRLNLILQRINQVTSSHQLPVRLIAISKTKPIEDIIELYHAGQRYFGENYVEELEKKSNHHLIREQCPDIRWHFVGHLQRKKISRIITRIPNLDCIQTIDSIDLANRLNFFLEKESKRKLNILIQINTSEEKQKYGIEKKDFLILYEYIKTKCPLLICQGLMTIGSLNNVQTNNDQDFHILNQCREELCKKYNYHLNSIQLSMGMSHDFERAIQAGSTIVRVGSLIFGAHLFMEYNDADPTFRARFLEPKFDPDAFVQSVASKSIGSTDLSNIKRRMYLISSEVKSDLKENVYRNHTKFIETAKQVSSLESEIYQLQTLLADEKQLLNTVKELLNMENKPDVSEKSDNDSWETLLRHCQNLGLVTTNSDRQLIYSGQLIEAKLENFSYITYPCYALLFNDYFIIVKTTNIRIATAYNVDQIIKIARNTNEQQQQQYSSSSSSSIEILNVKDDILRNSFSIKYNLEIIILICDNASIKKHWLEIFDHVLYKDSKQYSINQSDEKRKFEEEFFSQDWIKNTEENLFIYLAERNFDQTLLLIRQAKKYIQEFFSQHEQQSITSIDQYKKMIQEKEQDLLKLIEKEILYICERGCTTNLLKHYYHHIQILKQLGYVTKACELFFTIQLSLMKTTLKQTKLEELNVVFVENFTNTFFTRLVDSYYEFVQIFKDQKSTFTKFIVWMTIEIEKFISILHQQQYIGTKNFTFSMKNLHILLTKADEFSLKLIDIKFIFENQLEQLLIQIIRSQKDIIIDILRQRHRDEKWIPITFQTHERLEQLFFEFHELGIDSQEFLQPFIHFNDELNLIQVDLAPSTLQFTKAYLTFSKDLFQIHYLAINYIIIEALIELIKLHLKYFERALQKIDDKNLKIFIMKNIDFSINHLFRHVEQLYRPKLGNEIKYFTKIYDKMNKFQQLEEY